MFERESLFKMIFNKEWEKISDVLCKNSKLLKSDPIIQQAIQLFENEFFADISELTTKEKLLALEYPGLIIELDQKSFSSSFVERFLDEKLKIMMELKSDAVISFAASHQERPLARKILKNIQSSHPESIADARRIDVSINSTATDYREPRIINLFKSKQEENFFEAIRQSFPTYHPYPNVALSCVLDFEKIKNKLDQSQKNYYFRAIIDSVVFDSANGYKPMYFFELDSHFHDNDIARKNDAMKNAIFEAGNVKLIRIRAHESRERTVKKFQELVLEVMRGL